jgi:hypothetical protein
MLALGKECADAHDLVRVLEEAQRPGLLGRLYRPLATSCRNRIRVAAALLGKPAFKERMPQNLLLCEVNRPAAHFASQPVFLILSPRQ